MRFAVIGVGVEAEKDSGGLIRNTIVIGRRYTSGRRFYRLFFLKYYVNIDTFWARFLEENLYRNNFYNFCYFH